VVTVDGGVPRTQVEVGAGGKICAHPSYQAPEGGSCGMICEHLVEQKQVGPEPGGGPCAAVAK